MTNVDFDIFADLDQEPQQAKPAKVEPLYQIFPDSRVPVSRAVGKMWQRKIEAAIVAHDTARQAWDEAYKYYNHHQQKAIKTPLGVFHRGDSTENVVYSNVNTVVPAVYSKNPDININTVDKDDEAFVKTLKSLINVIIRRRAAPGINLKLKAKRAAMVAELTNFGIIKLDYVQKEDGREAILANLEAIGQELEKEKDPRRLQHLYGQLQALETQAEVYDSSGPKCSSLLAHNLIVDPNAEDPDACDGQFMCERAWLPTELLNAKYTRQTPEGRVLVYQPTHKAKFSEADAAGDDAWGLVLQKLSDEESETPTEYTDEERLAYQYTYMTEVYWIWDKVTRRLFLFHKDDWAWPIWVWDDPLRLSRFFPYFIMGFNLNLSGAVGVGEASFYLDQQDEINAINKQVAMIRRSVFNLWVYNSDAVKGQDAQKVVEKLITEGFHKREVLGLKLGNETKVEDVLKAIVPPSMEFEQLFNKAGIYDAIDRIGSLSDALRGVQFKANTTEDAVQSYMSAVRLRIGAKIDVVEDVIGDVVHSLCELCVQFMDVGTVEGLIGRNKSQDWNNMSVEAFNATMQADVVAGSSEKPTSIFKKKEAIEIAQAIGQFANAAPGATLRILLRLFQNAFTEVNIKPEDWQAIDQELAVLATKGVSTGGGAQPQGQGGAPFDVEAARNAPPEVKQRVVQMAQQGVPQEQIVQFLQQVTNGASNGRPVQ